MAVSFVNTTFSGTNTTASGTSATYTVATATTSGNTLVLSCGTRETVATTITVTDSKSNTWTVDNAGGQGNNDFLAAASTRQDGGALTTSDTITVTLSQSRTAGLAVQVLEFSGVLTASYADGNAYQNNGGASTSGATGSVTPTVDGDVLVTSFVAASGMAPFTGNASGTVGTYSTLNQISPTDAGSNPKTFATAYQILGLGTSGVAQQHDVTSGTSGAINGIITAYKAGAPPPPQWAHVGTDQYKTGSSGQTTFTTAAGTVGNLRIYTSTSTSATITVSALSGGGVASWQQAGTSNTANSSAASMWWGIITDAGTSLTVTYSSSIGSTGVDQRQVDFSPPGPSVSLVNEVNSNSASSTSIAWGSITPSAAGDLYFGDSLLAHVGSAGSTSGYTYVVDAQSNLYCYNTNVTAGAQAPTATQSSAGYYDCVAAIFTAPVASRMKAMNLSQAVSLSSTW